MARTGLCLVVLLTLLTTGIAETPAFPADDKNGKCPSVIYDSEKAFRDLKKVDRLISQKEFKKAEALLDEIREKSGYEQGTASPLSLSRDIKYYDTLLQDRTRLGKWEMVKGLVSGIDKGPAYMVIEIKGRGTYSISSRLLDSKNLDLLKKGSTVTIWHDGAYEIGNVVRIVVH